MANTYPIVIREQPSNNPTDYRFATLSSAANNGILVKLAAKETTRDVYAASTTYTPGTDELWLATGVELVYEEGKNIGDYQNPANKPFRVERVKAGGIYAISADGLTNGSDAAAEQLCLAVTGGKMKIASSAGSGESAVGTVISTFTRGGIKFVSIRFNA